MAGGIIYDNNVSIQGSESLLAEKINENLNQAIDIIVSKKMESLAFDKTEICLIEEKDGDEYTVHNGSISYKARSSGREYSKGQKVYVSIPNNDYNNVKTITGICADPSLNADNYYINIFDSFIDVTGNILNNENLLGKDNVVKDDAIFSLVANGGVNAEKNYGPKNVYILGSEDKWVEFSRPLVKYGVLAFSFGLNTRLYTVKTGTYGVTILLKCKTADGVETNYEYTKKTNREYGYSDFSGNPYGYGTFATQQFKIDLPEGITITHIKVFVFQDDDFENDKGLLQYTEAPKENILFNNFKIDFGWPTSIMKDGQADEIFLSSPDSYYYTRTSEDETFTRRISLNWVHTFNQLEEKNSSIPMVLNSKEDFETYRLTDQLGRFKISWYEWKEVASEEDDENTGKFWKKLDSFYWTSVAEGLTQAGEWISTSEKDPFSYPITIEENTSLATYKVFIEYGLGVVSDFSVNEIDPEAYTSVESEEITFYATVPKAEGLRGRDLIEGLSFWVDDGLKGQYYLYDQATNQLFSSVEKNRVRKLYALYSPAEQLNPSFSEGDTLYWRIPISDTLLNFSSIREGVYEIATDEEISRIFNDDIDISQYAYWKRTIKKEDLEEKKEDGTKVAKTLKEDYLEFTIKEEYIKTQGENSVKCKLTNSSGEVICGGKFDFFFNFQPATKTIIDPYWEETYIWKIYGNENEDGESGTIAQVFETGLKNPEALPVGGRLEKKWNYRYATKVSLRIYDYSGNLLFTKENKNFTNLKEALSNASISMGSIYDKQMNFSASGNVALEVLKGNLSVDAEQFSAKIEGQSDSGDTRTNLVFYEDNLYYISPLGTRIDKNGDNVNKPWIYQDLEDAWPEVINFKLTTTAGENVASSLPVHLFKGDFSFNNFTSTTVNCNYNLTSGSDLIVYDENGALTSGTANVYSLAVKEDNVAISWQVCYLKKSGEKYTEIIDDENKYFKFIGGYLQHQKDSLPIEKAYFVKAIRDDKCCYKLPLRLLQKTYGLAILSDWNGQNSPTIYGEKIDGNFSGVFSGYNSIQRYQTGELVKDEEEKTEEEETGEKETKEEETESIYGFYGYKKGYSIFALQNSEPYFTVQGLVKDSSGKIVGQTPIFTAGEESLFLRSLNYKAPKEEDGFVGQGMEINLAKGTINSKNANSVLYAQEIAVLTEVKTGEETTTEKTATINKDGLKVDANTVITGQTTLSNTTASGLSVNGDTTVTGKTTLSNATASQLSVKGSVNLQDENENGLIIDNEGNVTLKGGTLVDCTLRGDFQAEKATLTGVTIANGEIRWDSSSEINGAISNLKTLSFANNSTISGLGSITTTDVISDTLTVKKITFSDLINTNDKSISNLDIDKVQFKNKELKKLKLPVKKETNNGVEELVFDEDATEMTTVWVLVDGEEGD